MKYPASDKLEIVRMVEASHLGVKRTLEKIGVSRTTFYRWYDLYQRFGEQGLEDRRSGPGRVWNRIPDDIRNDLVDMALERPELSSRELAVTFTDERAYFVSEASVYRLLKAHDLITAPAFTIIKAADEFKDKTTTPNQLWQTDFTYNGVGQLLSEVVSDSALFWSPVAHCPYRLLDSGVFMMQSAEVRDGIDNASKLNGSRMRSILT